MFKAVGNFPSNSKAAAEPTVASATDTYFSGGTVTPAARRSARSSATRRPSCQPAVLGPHDGDVKNAISTAITRVGDRAAVPDAAWNQLMTKDIPAAVGS